MQHLELGDESKQLLDELDKINDLTKGWSHAYTIFVPTKQEKHAHKDAKALMDQMIYDIDFPIIINNLNEYISQHASNNLKRNLLLQLKDWQKHLCKLEMQDTEKLMEILVELTNITATFNNNNLSTENLKIRILFDALHIKASVTYERLDLMQKINNQQIFNDMLKKQDLTQSIPIILHLLKSICRNLNNSSEDKQAYELAHFAFKLLSQANDVFYKSYFEQRQLVNAVSLQLEGLVEKAKKVSMNEAILQMCHELTCWLKGLYEQANAKSAFTNWVISKAIGQDPMEMAKYYLKSAEILESKINEFKEKQTVEQHASPRLSASSIFRRSNETSENKSKNDVCHRLAQ